jgi:hypothetical protein
MRAAPDRAERHAPRVEIPSPVDGALAHRLGRAGVLLLPMACAAVPTPASAPPERLASTSAVAVAPGASATKARSMTVLVSNEPASTYCNGAQMDSAGYRRTLTQEKPLELPPEGASETTLVRAVVDAATEGMCRTVMRQLEYREDGGTLHIPPLDAWAGISITMCSCRPAVELNFARIPGVARVVWDGP